MRTRFATTLLLIAAVLGAGCNDDDTAEKPKAPTPVTQAALRAHLAALQHIADANGGERAAGTKGYDASVAYVAEQLKRSGWRVQTQQVPMAAWREDGPASLSIDGRALSATDFRVPSYSEGDASGTLKAVDDACEAEDFDGLTKGEVAFTGFGTCFLWRKTVNARRAGASALVVQAKGTDRGVASATLAVPNLGLPVVLMSNRVPARDGDRVVLE